MRRHAAVAQSQSSQSSLSTGRLNKSFMASSYCRASADVVGAWGRKMSFCTRHAEISDTNSSFGLRQSISWIELNSFSAFAGLPELPDNGSVELHLVDLAGDVARGGGTAVGIGVGDEQILMRSGRDADRPRVADVVVDRFAA